MLETSLANLNALLKNATDPETIKALTDAIADNNKALEELSLKDSLIDRQAKDIKKLYLNDTPGIPFKKDEDNQAPAQPRARKTLEQIIEEVKQMKG